MLAMSKQTIGYAEFQPLLDRFVSLVRQALGQQVLSVVLYGSVARGQARADSDVDLLIILREASPVYYERLQPFLQILRRLQAEPVWKNLEAQGLRPYLSLLILAKEEAEQTRYIYLDMVDEARILVDVGGFFQAKLEALRKRLRELGARRIWQGDTSWYWDLKPDLKKGEPLVL